jgi:hypothetical protein
MKQIFTLFVLGFMATAAQAQFTEKFENYNDLTSNCWQLTNVQNRTGSEAIEGTTSISSINSDIATINSPYLDFAGPAEVSFRYRLVGDLNGQAARIIEIGTTDKNGFFTLLNSETLNENTATNGTFVFNETVPFTAGTKRLTIRVVSYRGGGNTHVTFDELSVTASLHYSPQSCNTAPVAEDKSFGALTYATFNGDLSASASDANAGETLTFSLETLVTNYGTLVVNPDGTFAFTPNGDFNGGDITFTYKVTDNGYDPLSSNIATATITYAARATLPVVITNFSGSIAGPLAQLTWSVAQNEDGELFEIQKSNDGRNFSTIARVKNTQTAGTDQYNFADVSFKGAAYYRLKVINRNAASSYSKTILLQEKNNSTGNKLTLLQNPVVSTINISYNASFAGTATVSLYTTSGVKVYASTISLQRGTTQTTLATPNKVTPGAYILEVVHGTDRSLVKLVKL